MVHGFFRERTPAAAYFAAALLSALLLLVAPHSRAQASGAYTAHPPVFFKLRHDRVLVYLVNDLSDGTARVYIDTVPIGFLPRRSYTAAMVEPGFRLVWGTSEPKWYEFRAGWAYLLRRVRLSPLAHAWVADNPGIIRALVADKGLSYVTTDPETLTRQQLRAQKTYRDALQRAGSELALPYRKRFHTQDLAGQSPAMLQAGR
ncbi:MAG: hypothetical protein ACE5H7_15880 [Acidiferrobacterales bacterium]